MKEKEKNNHMNSMLRKIEIGCGKTKTEGYIGMDRFQLPGVDIVADLNDTFPIEDNSVDVVYACHSLEHLDSMEKTMSEIYRICKHKAIVQVLAPYYYATLNTANFYHVNVFNEDTFRFFTTFPDTGVIDKEEWYSPHSSYWGLSDSDNSTSDVQMELLNMEFFYYKEYVKLADEQKRRARRSFNNVCDQIYYELIINKSGVPFTPEEIQLAREHAKAIEPPLIQHIRNRDTYQEAGESLFDDFAQIAVEKISTSEEKLINLQEEKNRLVDNRFSQQQEEILSFKNEVNNLKKNIIYDLKSIGREANRNAEKIDEVNKRVQGVEEVTNVVDGLIGELRYENQILKNRLEYAEAINFEIYNSLYKESGFKNRLFNKKQDMYALLQENHTQFLDQLIFKSDKFNKKSILNFSAPIPWHTYREYELQGTGNCFSILLTGCIGAKLFVEIVKDNQIIKQMYITLTHDGQYDINVGDFDGKIYVRLKITNNRDIIRVLEINVQKWILFNKKYLASYVI